VNLAHALNEVQNRADDAIDAMLRAVALEPRSLVAQYDLACWLLKQQRIEESLEHARIAADIDPREPKTHRVLGRALAMLGQYFAAAESFRRALELTPGDEQLQTFLSKALSRCEDASQDPQAPRGP